MRGGFPSQVSRKEGFKVSRGVDFFWVGFDCFKNGKELGGGFVKV